jgi:hypothetical protein
MSRFSASPIVAAFARGVAEQEVNLLHDGALKEVGSEFVHQEEKKNQENEEQKEEDDDEDAVMSAPRKRKLQQVFSIGSRRENVRWMEQELAAAGKKELSSKAVAIFPNLFRGTYKANHQKASTWGKLNDNSDASDVPESFQRNQQSKCTRVNLKAVAGRGRKTSQWVVHVYGELIEEVYRLRKTGLKFSTALLGTLVRDIIKSDRGAFNAKYRDEDCKLIHDKITTRWVQTFMDKHNVVARAQTGKLQCSAEKELHVEKTIAYHLGELYRGFATAELDENLLENMDETHFVNVDNWRTLGIRGDNYAKYADVVSGGETMTMMLRIKGGVSSQIAAPMMIFTNNNRSYPI